MPNTRSPWDAGDPNRRDNQKRRSNRDSSVPGRVWPRTGDADGSDERHEQFRQAATRTNHRGLEKVVAAHAPSLDRQYSKRGERSNTELESTEYDHESRDQWRRSQRSGSLTSSGSTASSAIPAAAEYPTGSC